MDLVVVWKLNVQPPSAGVIHSLEGILKTIMLECGW